MMDEMEEESIDKRESITLSRKMTSNVARIDHLSGTA